MRSCIAGASTTVPSAQASVASTTSSASPLASRAIRFVLAGATTISSAQSASSTWISPGYAGSHRSVTVFCPVSPVNVIAPTKRVALGVIATRTFAPRRPSSRTSSTALKAAMPPLTQTRIFLFSSGRFIAFGACASRLP
jgi:hypothetical protein